MSEKKLTLNRFPLFGLFAHQAARHMGYSEDDARLCPYRSDGLAGLLATMPGAGRECRGDDELGNYRLLR